MAGIFWIRTSQCGSSTFTLAGRNSLCTLAGECLYAGHVACELASEEDVVVLERGMTWVSNGLASQSSAGYKER